MDVATLLREAMTCPRSRSSQQVDLVDDECSTDSGCSSGGSTGSAEVLSQERQERQDRHCLYVQERARGRSSSGQERLKQRRPAPGQSAAQPKPSRSWSPEERRPHAGLKSPSHSQSPSDAPSSDSSSLKRGSTPARGLRKAFQSLKISASAADKASAKKNQKRILRSPVAYTYVKGLSGLPTQRIPRNAV